VDLVNLRNGNGITVAPLNYGQHEVQIRVSRPDFAPQCFSFKDLELELVSVCEDTDWDSNQEMYQYQAHMNPDNGAVSVIHPKFVGRPVGETCLEQDPAITLHANCKDEASDKTDCPAAGIVDLDGIAASDGKDASTTPPSRYHGDGKWCYSDLNLAVGCTESPKTCWEKCNEEITALNNIKDEPSMKDVEAKGCPISFIQQTDDKGEKFECAPGKEDFELKAIDWEEVTGQCRCQHNCDCLVDDLVTYDVTKTKGTAGYETRQTTTHLLTKTGLPFPPREIEEDEHVSFAPTAMPTTDLYLLANDPWAPYKHCGLYTFTDASKANGPDTSRATFDVSWKD
jgi:hypothetical protein